MTFNHLQRGNLQAQETDSVSSSESISKFQEQMTPEIIRDRIRKRKPNPARHLTTKKATYLRFSDRCTRGAQNFSPWHDVDYASNKKGMRKMIVLDDGSEYIGEWEDNLRNGHGHHYTAKGYYCGEFADDKYDGNGDYYIWSDTTNCDHPGMWLLYRGNWSSGRYNGQGILYSTDNSTYEGLFVKGKKSGQGTMFYPNNDVYNGEWNNDLRNGEGEFTKANGDVFVGMYKDDKKNGDGVLHIAKSKRRLEGFWVDDMLKTGSYYDDTDSPRYVQPDDISGTTDGMIPPIQTKNTDQVIEKQIQQIEDK